jgi:hypothetical protein
MVGANTFSHARSWRAGLGVSEGTCAGSGAAVSGGGCRNWIVCFGVRAVDTSECNYVHYMCLRCTSCPAFSPKSSQPVSPSSYSTNIPCRALYWVTCVVKRRVICNIRYQFAPSYLSRKPLISILEPYFNSPPNRAVAYWSLFMPRWQYFGWLYRSLDKLYNAGILL